LQDYIFLEVSFLAVSVLAVSVAAGAGVVVEVESIFVLSDPLASLVELHPDAIAVAIVATSARLKICFFIVIDLKFEFFK
jgi:hypothetical protein